MTPEVPQQPDILDRFIERHRVLSLAAVAVLSAVVLESENVPAISAPIAAARHVLHM
jgi:hypothetical protein